MLEKLKPWELRFPSMGVNRRQVHERAASAVSYPTPWASNVRLLDPIASRLRGGSRAGLTKLVADDMGTTIADMVPIQVSSAASGTEQFLVIMVDNSIGVVDSGSFTTPVAYLSNEGGDQIITEAGDQIIISTADAPAAGFLIAGQQHAFAVDSTYIYQYNPKNGALTTLTASAGTVPTSCTFGAIYRDRMVLGGGDNAIYMSAQGDFTNWFFGKDLTNRSRALPFQLSHASKVGALTTALISHEDSHLLCATARGLWVVREDPANQGSLEEVDPHVGIISSRAWCKVRKNQYVFLAEDGLWQVAGDGSGLKEMTEGTIPEELRNIDTSTYTPQLGYDHDRRAVHIYLPTTAGAAATDTHWLFELEGGQFWPMHVQNDHSPKAVCEYDGDLLLGGSDGYIRKTSGDDDDGTNIESHLLVGPLRLGDAHTNGMIKTIHGVIGASSGRVYWRIVTGDTAEEAADNGKSAIEAYQSSSNYNRYVSADGHWETGRSAASWPRTSGMWACVWLQSTAKWAFEQITMESTKTGRWRDG